ncbi:MAG: GUN4 domain-containing protein [Nostoc sp.]|uniref:GUN4 domain-containing protein n=1 Tax=Nostoc sp. TaxID=1180 RepID=UPI002FEF536E
MIYEFDIFLSHASEDKDDFVDRLFTKLTNEYRVWYDKGEIPWGGKLDKQIEDGLNKSKYGIVILSDNYLSKHSKWIKKEFNEIVKENKLHPILHKIKMKDIEKKYPETYKAIENILAIPSENIDEIIKQAKKAIGEDSLCSRRNIDHSLLRDSLIDDNRELAAKKTYETIISAIDRPIKDFENEIWGKDADFITINRLWLKYTNGFITKYDLESCFSAEESDEKKNKIIKIIKQQFTKCKIEVIAKKASKESGVDYTKLQELLFQQKFDLADFETAKLVKGKPYDLQKTNLLSKKEMDNFYVRDLRTIDQLWLSASNGKFGLSVQKSVWIKKSKESNGKPTQWSQTTWNEFLKDVKWLGESDEVVFELSKDVRDGHLPLGLYVLTIDERDNKIKTKWERKIIDEKTKSQKWYYKMGIDIIKIIVYFMLIYFYILFYYNNYFILILLIICFFYDLIYTYIIKKIMYLVDYKRLFGLREKDGKEYIDLLNRSDL